MPAFRPVRFLVPALAAAVSAAPAAAQTVTLNFAEFRSPVTTEYQATPGGDVTTRGFDLYAAFGSGARNALGTWGTNDETAVNLPTNLGPVRGSLWGTQFGERIDLEASDGSLFDLYSIDVAHMYNRSTLLSGDLAPITLFFYGFNAAGQNTTALTQSFTIPAPAIVGGQQAPVFSTLVFGSAFRAVSAVAWFQQSGPTTAAVLGSNVSHQFTSIVAQVVPEPSTYVLLGAGLSVLLVAARRRREA